MVDTDCPDADIDGDFLDGSSGIRTPPAGKADGAEITLGKVSIFKGKNQN